MKPTLLLPPLFFCIFSLTNILGQTFEEHIAMGSFEMINQGTQSIPLDNCQNFFGDKALFTNGNFINQVGMVWNQDSINLEDSFDVRFSITCLGNGDSILGEGFMFVFQQNGLDSNILGNSGASIGYENLDTSFAVEFDLNQNPGPSYGDEGIIYDHITIDTNGNLSFPLLPPVPILPDSSKILDSITYYVKIRWDAKNHLFEVFFGDNFFDVRQNKSHRVSFEIDIVNQIFNGNPIAYLGFIGDAGATTTKLCASGCYQCNCVDYQKGCITDLGIDDECDTSIGACEDTPLFDTWGVTASSNGFIKTTEFPSQDLFLYPPQINPLIYTSRMEFSNTKFEFDLTPMGETKGQVGITFSMQSPFGYPYNNFDTWLLQMNTNGNNNSLICPDFNQGMRVAKINGTIPEGNDCSIGTMPYYFQGNYSDNVFSIFDIIPQSQENLDLDNTYHISLIHSPDNVQIYINDILKFDIDSCFEIGRLGVYGLGVDSIMISNFNSELLPYFNIISNDTICQGEYGEFFYSNNCGNSFTPDVIDSITWDFSEQDNTYYGNSNNPIHQFNGIGLKVITMTLYQNGCLSSFQDSIYVIPFSELDLGSDTTLCFGALLYLDATLQNAPDIEYLWENNSMEPTRVIGESGMYSLERGNGDCTQYDTIIVNYLPEIDLDVDINSSCINDSTGSLIPFAMGGGGELTYMVNDSNVFVDLPSGDYIVSVKDSFNCQNYLDVNIPNYPYPELALDIIDVSCFGENDGAISIIPIDNNLEFILYKEADTIGIGNLSYYDLTPGVYDLQITDQNGCIYFENYMVWEPPFFEIEIATSFTVSVGGPLHLSPQIIGFDNVQFLWSIIDGNYSISCDSCSNITLSPLESGKIFLKVSNNEGLCIKEVLINIIVDNEVCIFVPNIFTPNNDGFNDQFIVYGNTSCIEQINSVYIFDRKGGIIFSEKDFQPNSVEKSWDGKHKGKPMNPQVFVVTIEYVKKNGQKVLYKGDLTLKRF